MADFPEAMRSEISWLCLKYMYENVIYGKVMCGKIIILICVLDISRGNMEDIFVSICSTLFGRGILEGMEHLWKCITFIECWSNFSDKCLENIQKCYGT